jgi:hypothetical protein
MIQVLRTGMRVVLSSGNVLTLVRRERAYWVCVYVDGCKARGEVEFSGEYLRKWGREV